MIYFDNGSTSHPKADGAVEAMAALLGGGCFNINRGGYGGAYDVAAMVFDVREKLAAFFGCESGRMVCFGGGITQSLNIALKGLLRPGDHVVTTQMEHNAVMRPLAQLQARGVQVDVARCTAEGLLDMGDMAQKITDRTRLVVMTHASNVCGSILPVSAVGALCRRRGALLLVDSAQTAGALPIHMRADGIDLLAFAGHKGLLAAQGIGGLILSQKIADEMEPLIAGGTGSHSHLLDMPKELPDRLEAGTLNLPGIASLGAALDYIGSIGIERIYGMEMALLAQLTEGIAHMGGVRIVGLRRLADKCGIAALDIAGMDPAEVCSRLDEDHGIMTRCGLHCAPAAHRALGTYPRGVVRCSFGHRNTPDEVDALLCALRTIVKGR